MLIFHSLSDILDFVIFGLPGFEKEEYESHGKVYLLFTRCLGRLFPVCGMALLLGKETAVLQ